MTAPHCGHLPFFPANAAGTLTGFWHAAQANSIVAVTAAGLAAGRVGFPGVERSAEAWDVSENPGICTFTPQLGHLPFRPAVSSGVRINFPHPGQWNSIGMRSGPG
jgi:hypothetical protein